MPRPRHPIREHFNENPGSSKINGGVTCRYCGKEQSAGNPRRIQKHLDECDQYAQVLRAVEDGGSLPLPLPSAFSESQSNNDEIGNLGTPNGNDFLGNSQYANSSPSPGMVTATERMSEENIKRVLRVTDVTYIEMEKAMDVQMVNLNLSGAGFLTPGGMKQLRHAFLDLNMKWPDILHQVTPRDREVALTSMAYICNKKRRDGEPPNPHLHTAVLVKNRAPTQSTPQTPARARGRPPAAAPTEAPTTSPNELPPQIFGLTTIIAERAVVNGPFIVCRPSDLVDEPKPAEAITVDDVKFMQFIQLLQDDEDVLFNAANDDRIMFTFIGGRTKSVNNEVVWRVALSEMHKKGMNPIIFKIYKRQMTNMM